MTKTELVQKCDDAIAACLDQVIARAKNQESNNALAFANAAQTVQCVRNCVDREPLDLPLPKGVG